MKKYKHPHEVIEIYRDVLPNIALQWLAKDSLDRAKKIKGRYQLYLCAASITFSALALEAVLNLIGRKSIKKWEDLESTASPIGKLIILENVLKFDADRSKTPFDGFRELFKFRNLIVHAKPDLLLIKMTPESDYPIPVSRGQTPLSQWEKIASLKNSQKLVSRSEKMIDFLAKKASIQIPNDDHAIHRVKLKD